LQPAGGCIPQAQIVVSTSSCGPAAVRAQRNAVYFRRMNQRLADGDNLGLILSWQYCRKHRERH
jgi:hypothetical protein